ncbi:MAG: DUF3619 family protein, partial [Caldimonas sp.]
MNQNDSSSSAAARDAMQARFARRVIVRLNEKAEQLDGDVAERLRFAREGALKRARAARAPVAAPTRLGATSSGAAMLGGGSGWWVRVGSVIPLIALVGGLILIQQLQTRTQISVAAEVDA